MSNKIFAYFEKTSCASKREAVNPFADVEIHPDILAEMELDYHKAIAVIKDSNQAGVNVFRRRLKMSRERALKITSRLEKEGIIGPEPEPMKPRVIFFDKLNKIPVEPILPTLPAKNGKVETDSQVADSLPEQLESTPSVGILLSSALTSEPESPRITTPSSGAKISDVSAQACTPEPLIQSADASISAESNKAVATAGSSWPQAKVEQASTPHEQDEVAVPTRAISSVSTTTIKMCVMAYLPPPKSRFNTASFLENLKRNPPSNYLITFSETHEFKPTIPLKLSPEVPVFQKGGGAKDKLGRSFSVHNLVWLWAMTFAWKMEYTHVLYIEEDARVKGAGWDQAILDEYLREAPNSFLSGTMAIYNPCNTDRKFWLRYCELIARCNLDTDKTTTKGRNFPIATWGWEGRALPPITTCTEGKGMNDATGSCVFINGAGGIYSVAAFRELFPEIDRPDNNAAKTDLAVVMPPFDMEIGKRIFAKYADKSFDLVHHNAAVYSTFGNVITTEEERLTMLRGGAVRLVHSVKNKIVE